MRWRAGCSICVVVAANALGYALGCGQEQPKTPAEIRDFCAGEARATQYVGGATDAQAMEVYARCISEHGLRMP